MRGFVRISAAVPATGVADFQRNANNTLALWRQAHENESALVVFPELGLTGYSTRDLLHDTHLLDAAENSLLELAYEGREFSPVAIVGLPVRWRTGIYNAAAAIHGGRILGIVPKAYLPNYREFEEARWFRPGVEVPEDETIRLGGEDVPFGMDILLAADNQRDFVVGIEICEDYWVQVPPSTFQVGAGATVIANLSASNFIVGKAELRRTLASAAADRGKCAYVYVAAGPGESSTDVAFDADAAIVENGRILAEQTIRTSKPTHQRRCRPRSAYPRPHGHQLIRRLCEHQRNYRRIPFSAPTRGADLQRDITAHPFLPANPSTLATRTWKSLKSRSTHSPHDSRRPV